MDSGNDSADNMRLCYEPENRGEFIIKRNLRQDRPEMWLDIAQNQSKNQIHPREGKTVYIGSVYWPVKGIEKKVRVVYRVIQRTSTPQGQLLLVPEIEIHTWLTSLAYDEQKIIELYDDHGTSEQFHSELKTDMDIERLPSGKFATNSLILQLTMIAYNILRRIGQESLTENDSPLRKTVHRRRLRTVIQNLVLIATRVVTHARSVYLNLGQSNAWDKTFQRIYYSFVF